MGRQGRRLRILSILDIGYRQLTTSAKHPVRKLADAKGIKIRTPQNALMVSTFKLSASNPPPFPSPKPSTRSSRAWWTVRKAASTTW